MGGICSYQGEVSSQRKPHRKKKAHVHSRTQYPSINAGARGRQQQRGCVYDPHIDSRGQDTGTGSTISWYQDENIGLLLLKLVWKYKMLIFTKTTCPRCDEIKMRLDEQGIDYCFIVLDEEEYGSEMMRYIGKLTGAYTVPRVFCNGRFLGGGDETLRELTKLQNGQETILRGVVGSKNKRWW